MTVLQDLSGQGGRGLAGLEVVLELLLRFTETTERGFGGSRWGGRWFRFTPGCRGGRSRLRRGRLRRRVVIAKEFGAAGFDGGLDRCEATETEGFAVCFDALSNQFARIAVDKGVLFNDRRAEGGEPVIEAGDVVGCNVVGGVEMID